MCLSDGPSKITESIDCKITSFIYTLAYSSNNVKTLLSVYRKGERVMALLGSKYDLTLATTIYKYVLFHMLLPYKSLIFAVVTKLRLEPISAY